MEDTNYPWSIDNWELWMHPYPVVLKRSRRVNPALVPFGQLMQESDSLIGLRELFEARKKTTPVQLKRCVVAIVKDLTNDDLGSATREDVSKAFAICTKQFQKYGYLQVGTQTPTGKGKTAGKKKAAEKEHGGKIAEYEKLIAQVRKGKEESVERSFKSLIRESGADVMNVANVPVEKARALMSALLGKYGKEINSELPNFDENYKLLQKKVKSAFDVPRSQMPVIRQIDLKELDDRLKEGHIDIFQPWAKGALYTPTTFKGDDRGTWLKLGLKDGSKTDDMLDTQWTSVPAKSLLPTQNQVWVEKLAIGIGKDGAPKPGSFATDTTIVVSGDNYILDGHHRWGQVMLADPNMKMKILYVPIPIKTLIRIGKTYGAALGNKPRE
jgi:hypothetical protein